ncbi:MAG TPA: HAD-IA family hydrolase [Kofleriaceae bacterium]|nr:HAD-IA family hydrolase [Kofleriaceae bacterium]
MGTPASVTALLDSYDGVLLDAYGVLNDAAAAMPGAAELMAELARRGMPHLVVTNDASRLPATVAARLRRFGVAVRDDAVLTSGMLLDGWFAARGLAGARCVVLGTDDSRTYVERAGGIVAPLDGSGDVDVIAVGDDDGFPFLEGINAALTSACRALDAGRRLALVLPNPDLIFPAGGGAFGFTSGAIALLLEAALERRYPERALAFEKLGKPHTPLFEEAIARLGTRRLLMVGDQLETDIAGARAAGLDAALLISGVSRRRADLAPELAPTFVVDRL